MKLSIILKQLIQDKKISIVELAKRSSVPAQTIHNWVSGAEPRSVKQLKSIARELEVDLDYLCFGETENEYRDNNFIHEITAGVFEIVLRKPRTKKGR